MNPTGVKKYVERYTISLRDQWAYPVDMALRLINLPIQLGVMMVVWGVIFSYNSTYAGLTYSGMIAYVFIALGFENITNSRRINNWIANQVMTGNILINLSRPINYFWYQVFNFAGIKTVWVFLTASILSIAYIRFGIPFEWAPFLVAIALVFIGFATNFLLYFCIGTLSFWLERTWGVALFISQIALVLSGALFPITLFPPALQEAVRWLPFSHGIGIPAQLITGQISIMEAIPSFYVLGAWIIVLAILRKILWEKGLRAYDGKG